MDCVYPGLHQVSDLKNFERACINIHRIGNWNVGTDCEALVDSGAYRELDTRGEYRDAPSVYAAKLWRLWNDGVMHIDAAVSQDYMCEAHILAKTGLTIAEHQKRTIERYDALVAERFPFHLMPVLQGYAPAEYAEHVGAYGARLTPGMWVGVGSVCKRNSNPSAILAVLNAILAVRPDLRLHGFGIKITALQVKEIRDLLSTVDSMAWSYNARMNGRNQNDWREADAFRKRIEGLFQ